jgi:hypothetical protein
MPHLQLRYAYNMSEVDTSASALADRELECTDGKFVPFDIIHGWNPRLCLECDSQWSTFNLKLFKSLDEKNLSEDESGRILSTLQLEDSGWNWFQKSLQLRGSEYEWFYLYADGKPQGMCLIYHPKKSEFDEGDIFYVEYLAAAPWNRSSALHERDVAFRCIRCRKRQVIMSG